jgi:hypothetical protein
LFAEDASFAVGDHMFQLRWSEAVDHCEFHIFRDKLPVNSAEPVKGRLPGARHRSWVGRLGIRRELLGNLRLAIELNELRVVPTDELNHVGLVYAFAD